MDLQKRVQSNTITFTFICYSPLVPDLFLELAAGDDDVLHGAELGRGPVPRGGSAVRRRSVRTTGRVCRGEEYQEGEGDENRCEAVHVHSVAKSSAR